MDNLREAKKMEHIAIWTMKHVLSMFILANPFLKTTCNAYKKITDRHPSSQFHMTNALCITIHAHPCQKPCNLGVNVY